MFRRGLKKSEELNPNDENQRTKNPLEHISSVRNLLQIFLGQTFGVAFRIWNGINLLIFYIVMGMKNVHLHTEHAHTVGNDAKCGLNCDQIAIFLSIIPICSSLLSVFESHFRRECG